MTLAFRRSLVALRRRLGTRELRLGSGLVLGLFLLLHAANLALGLVSVEAMDAARPFLMGPWSRTSGTLLLGGALLLHIGLTLRTLFLRRTLRMTRRETMQLGFGLLIPLLLAPHVVAARIVPQVTDHWPGFHGIVATLALRKPGDGFKQVILLLVAWIHVSLGLWFWLRARPGFAKLFPVLCAGAAIVPLLAILGFAEAARQLAAQPMGPAPTESTLTVKLTTAIELAFAASVGVTMAARGLRNWRGRHAIVRVTFPDGKVVAIPRGATVLEASRLVRFPHVAMCGGRGRCSTCRIRVPKGLEQQPDPTTHEAATLQRFRAAPDIRLACQLRPSHDLTVYPIFAPMPPPARAVETRGWLPEVASRERELSVLFCDLRGFTRRAEQLMPFDTVYILNRYFELVGRSVEAAGGHLDKFIGDGALALFGLDAAPEAAARQAVDAAARVAQGLATLNGEMSEHLAEPLRIAMGLHAGIAIVGEMGYGAAVALTAVGDAINVASRLEGVAKEMDVEAVLSVDLARRAGLDRTGLPARRIAVRGRAAEIDALLIADAASLSAPLATT